MTDSEIDRLINARNAITDRTNKVPNWKAVDAIDTLLSECQPGRRNDVDQLLGRLCATPSQTPRVVMVSVNTADKCETKYDEAWFEHEVIAARAASTDQQYVSLTDLMHDYEAREDMRHLMSGKTA